MYVCLIELSRIACFLLFYSYGSGVRMRYATRLFVCVCMCMCSLGLRLIDIFDASLLCSVSSEGNVNLHMGIEGQLLLYFNSIYYC